MILARRRALIKDNSGTGDGTLGDIKGSGDGPAARLQRCSLIGLAVAAMLEGFHLRRDHGALARIEMTAVQVTRQHEGQRVVAAIRDEGRLDASDQARLVPVNAIEDRVLEKIEE